MSGPNSAQTDSTETDGDDQLPDRPTEQERDAGGSRPGRLPARVPALGSGYARFAGVGIHFAVTILVFAYVGYRLDLWLDSSPWFLLVGVFLGFGGGMISMISKVKKVTAKQIPGKHSE